MSLYSFFLFSAVTASLVADVFASNVTFTFPKPGKNDYSFRDGDTAIVMWKPNVLLEKVYLTCGLTSDVQNSATVTGIQFENAWPGTKYHANWAPQEGNHTYCMFCSGEEKDACSGVFHLLDSLPGISPQTWSLGNLHGKPNSSCSTSTVMTSKRHTQTNTPSTSHNSTRISFNPARSSGLHPGTGPIITTTIIGYYVNATSSSISASTAATRAPLFSNATAPTKPAALPASKTSSTASSSRAASTASLTMRFNRAALGLTALAVLAFGTL